MALERHQRSRKQPDQAGTAGTTEPWLHEQDSTRITSIAICYIAAKGNLYFHEYTNKNTWSTPDLMVGKMFIILLARTSTVQVLSWFLDAQGFLLWRLGDGMSWHILQTQPPSPWAWHAAKAEKLSSLAWQEAQVGHWVLSMPSTPLLFWRRTHEAKNFDKANSANSQLVVSLPYLPMTERFSYSVWKLIEGLDDFTP